MDSIEFEPPEWGSSPWDRWLDSYLASDPFFTWAASSFKGRLLRWYYKRVEWKGPK